MAVVQKTKQIKPCPVCQSEKDKSSLCKVSFTFASEYDLSECPDCHVIYFNPTPTIEEATEFYSICGYDYNRWKFECKADSYIKKLNRIKRVGKFLDIGCATAYMINKIAMDSDWEVYGVELSKRPAEFARDVLKLKNVTHGDLFSAKYPDNFFDCINISDVLEHVPDPVAMLDECHRILKSDGIILLGVPNGYNDSRGLIRYYREFGRAGCHDSGHIFFFQKPTFDFLFRKTGFDVLRCETVAIKNGLRNIGLLPRKRNWADFYRPRQQKEVATDSEIQLVTHKKYPDFYYRYRYLKHTWFAIPGYHNFGLDLNFVLTPSKQ